MQQTNNIKHKASFLASIFLNSKESLKYKLNSVDREIIRYLCDCIDMNFSKSGKFEIKISHNQIANYIGSTSRTIRRRIPRLINIKIIEVNKIDNGQMYKYLTGNILNNLGQNVLPPRTNMHLKSQNLGHSVLHLTKDSNNYTNEKNRSSNKIQEPKQTAKFWEPGNPDYDRVHKN